MHLSRSIVQSNQKKIIVYSLLIILAFSVLSSYIISLLAFISPTQELRWSSSITYVNKPVFNPGNTVTVTGFLEEGTEYFEQGNYYFFTSTEDVRWILNVMDPNNLPIYMESGVVTNAISDITDSISFTLPPTAITGTYKIRLLVWAGWLPDGETRTYIINEFEFEVV